MGSGSAWEQVARPLDKWWWGRRRGGKRQEKEGSLLPMRKRDPRIVNIYLTPTHTHTHTTVRPGFSLSSRHRCLLTLSPPTALSPPFCTWVAEPGQLLAVGCLTLEVAVVEEEEEEGSEGGGEREKRPRRTHSLTHAPTHTRAHTHTRGDKQTSGGDAPAGRVCAAIAWSGLPKAVGRKGSPPIYDSPPSREASKRAPRR